MNKEELDSAIAACGGAEIMEAAIKYRKLMDLLPALEELDRVGDAAFKGEVYSNKNGDHVCVQSNSRDVAHFTMDGEPFFYSDNIPKQRALYDIALRDAYFVRDAYNSRPTIKALVELLGGCDE